MTGTCSKEWNEAKPGPHFFKVDDSPVLQKRNGDDLSESQT